MTSDLDAQGDLLERLAPFITELHILTPAGEMERKDR